MSCLPLPLLKIGWLQLSSPRELFWGHGIKKLLWSESSFEHASELSKPRAWDASSISRCSPRRCQISTLVMFTCWFDGVTNDFTFVTISWLAPFQEQAVELLFNLLADMNRWRSFGGWLIFVSQWLGHCSCESNATNDNQITHEICLKTYASFGLERTSDCLRWDRMFNRLAGVDCRFAQVRPG